MNKFLPFLFCFILSGFSALAQIQSNGTGGGNWNSPATWQGGIIPDFNSAAITILSGDAVNVDANFTIDQTTIQNGATLTVDAGVVLTINNGTGTDLTNNGTLGIDGEIALTNLATHTGLTALNTSFNAGSIFRIQYTTTQAIIPLATWDATSTLLVTGYTSLTTATAAGNWSQSFGNVQWSCTSQTATLNLSGLFTTVNGDFTVTSTGSGVLRFRTTGSGTISVAGDVSISGSSRLGFCTTGSTTMNIGGDYIQNLSAGYVRLADGTAGVGTINITGNFNLLAGIFTENGGAPAQGNINFVGPAGTVHTFTEAGTPTTTLTNTLSYTVADGNELTIVGESQIAAGGTSFFTLGSNAILYVESTDIDGAIQTGTNQGAIDGNIQVSTRTYNAGSQIVYSGSSAQFMGAGQPSASGITTVINNGSGVTQAVTSLTLSGDLVLQTGDLTVSNGNLTLNGTTDLQAGDLNFITANNQRTLTINGDINLSGSVNVTSGNGNANVIFSGDITGGSAVNFTGNNSRLTINGTGDLIFPLSGPTSLEVLTSSRDGNVIMNETLNVNTNAGASAINITTGTLTVNADINGRNIVLTNGSSLLVTGTTALTNSLIITDGVVQTDGELTISNDLLITAGSLDANGSVTITDDLTMEAGTTFFFEDQSVTLNSQLFNNGGVFSSNSSSTLNILNTGVLGTIAFAPAPSNELGSLIIDRPTGGTLVTLNSSLTIITNLDLLDGDFLNTSGLDMASGSILTRSSTAAFVAGSAIPTGGPYDVILSGGTLATGVETQGTLENVTVTATGTVTLTAPLIASGNFSLNAGTFISGANLININNFLNSATLFNAPSSTLSVSGDFVNNSPFNNNSGSIDFTGVTVISGSNNPTFNNLVITGSLTPSALLNLVGAFTNNGFFDQGTGSVSFLGTAGIPQVVSGTSVTTFFNMNVSNTTAAPDVTIDSDQNIEGVLTLANNATFDADGSSNSSVFTLLSTSDDPDATASINTMTGASQILGNVTSQRFMSGENRIYRYISSPISGATIAQWQNDFSITGTFADPSTTDPITGLSNFCGFTIRSNSPSLYYYNESQSGTFDDGWIAYPTASSADPIVVGRGYAPFIRQCTDPTLITVSGPVNQGIVNYTALGLVTYTNTGSLANDGWNLIGNPYPAAIRWDATGNGWTKGTNINTIVNIRDNGSGGVFVPVFEGEVIAQGQAFWVKADGADATLILDESAKDISGAVFYKQSAQKDMMIINLTKGNVTDKAYVRIKQNALAGYDREDAINMNNELFDVATLVGNLEMGVNTLNSIDCSNALNLHIKDMTNGSYSFSVDREGLFSQFEPTLHDKFTGSFTDLTQTTYTFSITSDLASRAADRFEIQLAQKPIDLALAVNEGSGEVCNESTYVVTIPSPQPFVSYAAMIDNVAISSVVTSSTGGSSLELIVDAGKLKEGINQVSIKAFNSCSEAVLTELVTVEKRAIKLAKAQSIEICSGTQGTIVATGTGENGTYKWYESELSETPLHTGNIFITPVINQSTTYYVSAVNSLGCEGGRVSVDVSVHYLLSAEVSLLSRNKLTSNYTTGNQWYYNNQKISGATNQTLNVVRSGKYRVEVLVNECITSSEYQFNFEWDDEGKSIALYPNPVSEGETLNVEILATRVEKIQVLNSSGRIIGSLQFEEQDKGVWMSKVKIEDMPKGLYYMRVYADGKSITEKFINNR